MPNAALAIVLKVAGATTPTSGGSDRLASLGSRCSLNAGRPEASEIVASSTQAVADGVVTTWTVHPACFTAVAMSEQRSAKGAPVTTSRQLGTALVQQTRALCQVNQRSCLCLLSSGEQFADQFLGDHVVPDDLRCDSFRVQEVQRGLGVALALCLGPGEVELDWDTHNLRLAIATTTA